MTSGNCKVWHRECVIRSETPESVSNVMWCLRPIRSHASVLLTGHHTLHEVWNVRETLWMSSYLAFSLCCCCRRSLSCQMNNVPGLFLSSRLGLEGDRGEEELDDGGHTSTWRLDLKTTHSDWIFESEHLKVYRGSCEGDETETCLNLLDLVRVTCHQQLHLKLL